MESPGLPERAALVTISPDGKAAAFDPTTGFVELPGGAEKFTVRFDPVGGLYWTLASIVPPAFEKAGRPAAIRNTLALVRSKNIADGWKVRSILWQHPDTARHGFQYVDWQFAGPDMIAVCRTAWDDVEGGAHNCHDANYLTFHRIANFRGRD